MTQKSFQLTFGKWVRDIKTDSLVELSAKTGIQPSNLSTLLKKDDISHQHLIKLCRALNNNLYFKAAIELSKSMLLDAQLAPEQQKAAAEKLVEIEKAVNAFHALLSAPAADIFNSEPGKGAVWNKTLLFNKPLTLEENYLKRFGALEKLKKDPSQNP